MKRLAREGPFFGTFKEPSFGVCTGLTFEARPTSSHPTMFVNAR